ncbi:MAG: GntR family transcriptional regulator [Albidovulum sp.]|jgi:DNA-binding GntR family transcriptional regulator|uniref:GntR family transcriptional regulator n=1 Tax=Albidovulum sp. TaxID=1872424 RepID=UPI00304CD554
MSDTPDPALPERRRGSGARMVYELLRDEILDMVLPPGAPIDEIQQAERLSISRTPIREALVRLAGEGLVTMLPNRSTVVSTIDFANLNAFFDALTLMYRVTTRAAAECHTSADMDRIRARQRVFAAAVAAGDAPRMIVCNRDFHVAIAEAGRNPYYTQLFTRLLDEGRRILRLYYYPSFEARLPHPYIVEHEAIIAAVEARDLALCDRLARDHADQIVRQIQGMIAQDRRQHIDL